MASTQDNLNNKAGISKSNSKQQAMNSLAGRTGLSLQLAANVYAGKTGLSTQQALNVKVGKTGLSIQDASALL
jgi:hypothetical protein